MRLATWLVFYTEQSVKPTPSSVTEKRNTAQAKLRAEAAEPFHFGNLSRSDLLATGAIVGLFIILSRLVQALKGRCAKENSQRGRFNRNVEKFGRKHHRRVSGITLKNRVERARCDFTASGKRRRTGRLRA